jgi:hypothetical protein
VKCFCGEQLKLSHKKIEVDTLCKLYMCHNGHRLTYRRYGYTIEYNGVQIESQLWYSEAARPTLKKG